MKHTFLLLTLLSSFAFAAGGSLIGSPTIFTAGTIKGGAGLTYILTPLEFDAGNSGSAITIDWTNGPSQKVTVTASTTLTLSNPVTGGTYVLKFVQDNTGSRTYTWPGSVKWPGGSSPTGSGANKIDLISLYYDGTNYLGSSQLNY